ncbi:MAG TPA: hypothetical protein DC038_03600 [Clostridiales bacterium]|nr:hypothetical protein [Clostridiales bacterium]
MESKPIKLSPKKNGRGEITSYTINIGSDEARQCGFVDSNGNIQQIEKFIDVENNQVVIKLSGVK